MRSVLPRVLLTSATLTVVLSALILLATSAFATSAGEVAFESNRDGNWEIYLVDVQTGFMHNLTRNPADDLSPSWSPDGSKISFTSSREMSRQEVYVMDANGSNVRRISTGSGIYRDPTWTPDGQTLVLTHGWRQIMLVDTLNSLEQWIGAGFAPQLSPDKRVLLYYDPVSGGSNSHIYTLELASHRITDLTPGKSHNWDAVWSPDGSRIAFVSLRAGRSAIYVMNRDGSDFREVTSGPNDVSPAWIPDGQRLVFSSGVNGNMRLYSINADGTDKRAISSGNGDNHAPVWRP